MWPTIYSAYLASEPVIVSINLFIDLYFKTMPFYKELYELV